MNTIRASAQPMAQPERQDATLETRQGLRFRVRRAAPEDFPALKLFLRQLTPDDIRFRFLSPMRMVSDNLVQLLLREDRSTEHFLVFKPGEDAIIASGMLAIDPDFRKAEVALCIRPEFKHAGISWSLLAFLLEEARARGVDMVEAIEAPDHREAIALEREMGFEIDRANGDPSAIVVRKVLSKA
jgi:acetyltransferase